MMYNIRVNADLFTKIDAKDEVEAKNILLQKLEKEIQPHMDIDVNDIKIVGD